MSDVAAACRRAVTSWRPLVCCYRPCTSKHTTSSCSTSNQAGGATRDTFPGDGLRQKASQQKRCCYLSLLRNLCSDSGSSAGRVLPCGSITSVLALCRHACGCVLCLEQLSFGYTISAGPVLFSLARMHAKWHHVVVQVTSFIQATAAVCTLSFQC